LGEGGAVADVTVPYRGGPLAGDEALLDEAELYRGRIFDYTPSILEEDVEEGAVYRYRLCQTPTRWEYHYSPAEV
jgi:hypothetical protein